MKSIVCFIAYFLFTVVIIHHDSKTMISNLLKKDNNSKNCEESLLSVCWCYCGSLWRSLIIESFCCGGFVAEPLLRRINRASR